MFFFISDIQTNGTIYFTHAFDSVPFLDYDFGSCSPAPIPVSIFYLRGTTSSPDSLNQLNLSFYWLGVAMQVYILLLSFRHQLIFISSDGF